MITLHEEAEFVQRCLNGEKQAFAFLVERYKTPVINLIFRLIRQREEANDLAQETFIKAYKNLRRYDSNYKFSTWLFQIAKNLSLDYLRKRRPDLMQEHYMEGIEGWEGDPEQTFLKHEFQMELEQAMAKLPIHLKTTLVLYHLNGLSYQEISEVLNIPLHTVKNQLFQARKKLKEYLGKEAGSDYEMHR